jgi:hypothetical protein
LEGWDIRGFPKGEEPSDEEQDAASAWIDACNAATEACCANWPKMKVPIYSKLELVDPADPDPADERNEVERLIQIVMALECAAGPDRDIDSAIHGLFRTERDFSTAPRYTEVEADALGFKERNLSNWQVRVEEGPDVQIWEGDLNNLPKDMFGAPLHTSAWRKLGGGLHMDRPPANTAIAITLGVARARYSAFD